VSTSAPSQQVSGRYIPEFDGMRGIAILLVMLYHFWRYKGGGVAGGAVDAVAHIGWAGVDIFFVLSGFLITRILLSSKGEPHYWRNFYIRRSLRIFPLYYAVMTVVLVAALLSKAGFFTIADPAFAAADRVWINFLYLTNFARAMHGIDYVPLDIAWSLAIEEQFYLVYPLVVWWASRQNLKRFLIAAILLAPVFRLASMYFTGSRDGAYVLPFCRMDALALGGITAMVLEDGSSQAKRWISRSWPVLAAFAVFMLSFYTRADMEFGFIGYSSVALATAAFIVYLFQGNRTFATGFLRTRLLVHIGKVSYGLYLLHLFARAAVDRVLPGILGRGWQQSFALSSVRLVTLLVVSLILATMSFYFFERRILALKDKYAPAQHRKTPLQRDASEAPAVTAH
jgi:peptidoglycan/LPS O-acetylase OafA/YrhL